MSNLDEMKMDKTQFSIASLEGSSRTMESTGAHKRRERVWKRWSSYGRWCMAMIQLPRDQRSITVLDQAHG